MGRTVSVGVLGLFLAASFVCVIQGLPVRAETPSTDAHSHSAGASHGHSHSSRSEAPDNPSEHSEFCCTNLTDSLLIRGHNPVLLTLHDWVKPYPSMASRNQSSTERNRRLHSGNVSSSLPPPFEDRFILANPVNAPPPA